MEEKKSEKENLFVMNFQTQNLPIPWESKNTSDTTYVWHGVNNQYPAFLLGLYADSATHSAIVNQKGTYIIGDGLKFADGKDLDLQINSTENIKQFSDKLIKDYLIFSAFAVEVCFNTFGEPIEYHHVPVHKIRMNKSKTKFWYNDDWLLTRKTIIYDRYNVKNNSDSTSKIFYFEGYFPSLNNVYSTPEYNGSLKSIVTDVAVKSFNLNNIKNHFSASTIITFFNGSNVTEEQKKSVKGKLVESYSGEFGEKVIVDFQNKDGKGADVKNLSANDWDKAYDLVGKAVVDDIMVGHTVNNPSLFGIKTAGSLGNSTELETSYEIFKNNYIQVKRDEIETALNQLFTNYKAIAGKIKFADKPLFNTKLADTTKEKVMTIDELRAIAGLPPLPNGAGTGLLSTAVAPIPVNVVPGAEPVKVEDVKKKPGNDSKGRSLTDADFELVKHLGSSFEDFDVVGPADEEHFSCSHSHSHLQFDNESDIAKYVVEHDIKGLTLPELVALLQKDTTINVTVDVLKSTLDKLHTSGILDVVYDNGGRVAIKPNPKPDVPDTDKIFVMYKYEKRPEINGNDLIPNSRGFCVKLMNNNKLYSRADIQAMGEIFNYDVFSYCGGYYKNPETGKVTVYCRHQFKAVKVKRKAKAE